MSRDYWVLWTVDFPTPRAFGLGGELLPWPAADQPWPSTENEREALGYPELRGAVDFVIGFERTTLGALPWEAEKALGGRRVLRQMRLQNDHEFAEDLADAGEGVAFDEEGNVVFPVAWFKPNPELARRRVAARMWVGMHPRPQAPWQALVDAAVDNDPLVLAVLEAWAPDIRSRPNLGVRHMKHDRELCERIWQRAQEQPARAAGLLRVLVHHGYFPVARRPELVDVAKAATVDVTAFVAAGKADGAERMKWFKAREPLD